MAKDVNRGIQVLRGVLCIMIMIFHSAAGFASIFWGGNRFFCFKFIFPYKKSDAK